MLRNRKKVQNYAEKQRILPKSKKPQSKCLQLTLIFGAFLFSFLSAMGWHYYIESRTHTPFPAPSAVKFPKHEDLDEDKQLWGTYRSHLYFGLRTRTPESVLFGLAWFAQYPKDGQLHIRYTCEQGDNLPRYGWLLHDGKTFGSQEIVDNDFQLETDFIKQHGGDHGGDWTARITGTQRTGIGKEPTAQAVSVMFIVSNEGSETFEPVLDGDRIIEIKGQTKTLGEFALKFQKPKGKVKLESFLVSYEEDIYDAKQAILQKLTYKTKEKLIGLPGYVTNEKGQIPNFIVHQVTLELPFEMDVVFQSESHESRSKNLYGQTFTNEFENKVNSFNEKFEKLFNLSNKGYSVEEVSFAKAAMSNMIGGIGYFHGKSKIKTENSKEPFDYWASGLYTGVPSRSFFPRGFLWDEGFHQLLIQCWDPSITRDVLAHWLDLLNYNGWIPREQILGVEARRKVPDEFVVQHSQYANPPTFFLTIQSLISRDRQIHHDVTAQTVSFLKHIFPRLVSWFNWYNSTQKGRLSGTYFWQGRDDKTDRELNPKTLTSGLDDYPRASHPSRDERHVDLRCWIALASGILADIAEMIGAPSYKYRETESYLHDNTLLDKLHWSNDLHMYADFGNHTKFVKLEWVLYQTGPNAQQQRKLSRVTRGKHGPSLKFVNELGYVSLFPFLLKIVKPDSPKLQAILDDIYDPNKLWTNFGLRSLSKTAPMYNKYNTEHDKPYWRGPIWININYLTLRALYHYASTTGPHQQRAHKIYAELRQNIVDNLFRNYKRTGYIWEQYDDATGKGQGCFPFTGWSGLVTLIMAEIY